MKDKCFVINFNMLQTFFCLVLCVFLFGCATPQQIVNEKYARNDPLESLNRKTMSFNTGVEIVISPILYLYKDAVPNFIQDRVGDFFTNLSEPITFVLDIAQLRGKDAGDAAGRFLTNSTVGLFGLFDFAKSAGIPHKSTSLNATLAVYGVPSGPYLVLPFLGPSTLRGVFGWGGELVVDPFGVSGFVRVTNQGDLWKTIPYYGVYGIHTMATYVDVYRNMSKTSLDFYSTMRDFYNQAVTVQVKKTLQMQGRLPQEEDDMSNFFG